MHAIHKGQRKVYENLFDWIKARFTRDGALDYFKVEDEQYMIYLPNAGRVHQKNLVNQGDAWSVIRQLTKMAK